MEQILVSSFLFMMNYDLNLKTFKKYLALDWDADLYFKILFIGIQWESFQGLNTILHLNGRNCSQWR